MDMQKAVLHCIESEDKRNPYTDEKIADILNLYRESVTAVRKGLKIPDSRERRKNELRKVIINIVNENSLISDRALAKLLNDQNFVIGKYAVSQLRKQLFNELQPSKESFSYETSFSKFNGYQGSQKNTVKRLIAAISYPPHGMHCLLCGPYGAGKSLLIQELVGYARSLDNFEMEAPYLQINCSEYKNNPQDLLHLIFGVVSKNEVSIGCLEELDGGFLYLKNINDFPIKGEEMLHHYFDTQEFSRINQPMDLIRSNVLIFASALNSSAEYSLHFPMVVELSSFDMRPISERLEFIRGCFMEESQRLGCDLTVKKEVITSLIERNYVGNFTQVRSEVKMICAKAYLEKRIAGTGDIMISFELLSDLLKSTNQLTRRKKENDVWIRGDLVFVASSKQVFSRSEMNDSWDIYKKLEGRIDELRQRGIDDRELSHLLTEEIEYSLSKQIRDVEQSKMSREEISIIVGDPILKISQEIYDRAKKNLPYLSESIIFPLAIHLKMLSERQQKGSRLKLSKELTTIKANCPNEYLIAKNILLNLTGQINIKNIEEEIVFLTVYFDKFQNRYTDETKRISVLVVSHGHVASAMAETANVIMGEQHAVGLDFEYQDSPRVMSERVLAKVKEIDQGKGCIILADMGSLLQVRQKIEKELGIHVGVLGRTDTLLVIECIRKTLWTNESIDEIIRSIDFKETKNIYEKQNQLFERPKAILTCCITGEGAAIQLEEYLRDRFESIFSSIHWVHAGYISETAIDEWSGRLTTEYDVLACVGTMNPHIPDVPFFKAEDVYTKDGLNALKKTCLENAGLYNPLQEVLDIDCITIADTALEKNSIIDEAVKQMISKGKVNEGFLLSVYKREAYFPTFLKEKVAIPHGEAKFITEPVIHITKLVSMTPWDNDNEVDFVFTLALDDEYVPAIEELYKRVKQPLFMEKLRKCKEKKEIYELFLINTVLDK